MHVNFLLMRSWAREPLVHFIAIGIVLSMLKAGWDDMFDSRRVVVTPQRVAQVANRYRLQFGAPPDGPTLEALIDRDIRDEVLFREGLALGVDKSDEMVRRRVIQKMEFVTQDLNPPVEPTPAQLHDYFDVNKARYTEPARASFTHVFFSGTQALSRAQTVLQGLNEDTPRAAERGDPFPDLYDYVNYEPSQVKRLFGASPLTEALEKQAPGHWFGPVQSSYGWHLVRISASNGPHAVAFDKARDRVRTDYLLDAQTRANGEAMDRLMGRYTIVRPEIGG